MWVSNQETGFAVHDLVDDSTDGTRYDRPRLPHRLRDREPESLCEALLRHDARMALESIDNERVLYRVGHRDRGQVDSGTACFGKP